MITISRKKNGCGDMKKRGNILINSLLAISLSSATILFIGQSNNRMSTIQDRTFIREIENPNEDDRSEILIWYDNVIEVMYKVTEDKNATGKCNGNVFKGTMFNQTRYYYSRKKIKKGQTNFYCDWRKFDNHNITGLKNYNSYIICYDTEFAYKLKFDTYNVAKNVHEIYHTIDITECNGKKCVNEWELAKGEEKRSKSS